MSTGEEALAEQLSILKAAVGIEEFGIEFYTRLAECVREEEGKALMRGLARDEMGHKRIIEEEIARVAKGKDMSTVPVHPLYGGIVPEKIFPFVSKDRCLTVKEEIEAIQIGMDVERKSIQMYEESSQRVADEAVRKRLKQLAGIENGHLKLLEENLQMLRSGGVWYGYSPILEG